MQFRGGGGGRRGVRGRYSPPPPDAPWPPPPTSHLPLAVEAALDPSKEQILVLNNGCLCCTVRDDLVEMLHQLVKGGGGGDSGWQGGECLVETRGMRGMCRARRGGCTCTLTNKSTNRCP